MVFSGMIKDLRQKNPPYNLIFSINILGKCVELKSRKEALIQEFVHLVSVEDLSASTYCLRHCSGLRPYLQQGELV